MISQFAKVFSDSSTEVRSKLFGIYSLLIALNVLAWTWAVVAFRNHPLLLGTALLAYGFGLRHAVDADHIAAIDNVTRKLMQEKKRPVAVGFFFSLGHSTVVVLASSPLRLRHPPCKRVSIITRKLAGSSEPWCRRCFCSRSRS